MAIARKIVVVIFHILKDLTPYRDLGADHVPTEHTQRRTNGLVRQLQALGFDVQLTPVSITTGITTG